jgi:hypothetical protein
MASSGWDDGGDRVSAQTPEQAREMRADNRERQKFPKTDTSL